MIDQISKYGYKAVANGSGFIYTKEVEGKLGTMYTIKIGGAFFGDVQAVMQDAVIATGEGLEVLLQEKDFDDMVEVVKVWNYYCDDQQVIPLAAAADIRTMYRNEGMMHAVLGTHLSEIVTVTFFVLAFFAMMIIAFMFG